MIVCTRRSSQYLLIVTAAAVYVSCRLCMTCACIPASTLIATALCSSSVCARCTFCSMAICHYCAAGSTGAACLLWHAAPVAHTQTDAHEKRYTLQQACHVVASFLEHILTIVHAAVLHASQGMPALWQRCTRCSRPCTMMASDDWTRCMGGDPSRAALCYIRCFR